MRGSTSVVNTSLPTGVPWVSRSGDMGLTVPPRDSAALAQAINAILRNRPLAKRFSTNAKTRAKGFPVEKMMDNVCSLYQEVLDVRSHTNGFTRRAG